MRPKLRNNAGSSGPLDSARIDVNRGHELRYWSRELRVDERTLRAAVQQVGPSAFAVRLYLEKCGAVERGELR